MAFEKCLWVYTDVHIVYGFFFFFAGNCGIVINIYFVF